MQDPTYEHVSGDHEDHEDHDHISGQKPPEEVEEPEEADPLDGNVYGLVLTSILRDGQEHVENLGKGGPEVRMMRILTSIALYFIMVSIQVFLIYCTKTLITPPQVKSIRKLYSDFEQHMYTDADGVEHTYKGSHGFLRGHDGFFNPDQFDSFDSKTEICMLPLSQPKFIFCILWIWLVTVLKEFRDAVNKIIRVIAATRREKIEVPGESKRRQFGSCFTRVGHEKDANVAAVVVQFVKPGICFISIFGVLLPRVLLCCYMAWLGSRWLVSTVGFSDVLLNAVALAFIFDLSTLIYEAAVPFQTQQLVTDTYLPHLWSKDHQNFRNFLGSLLLLVVATVLALIFMFAPQSWGPFAQHVLPDYKWDVGGVCGKHLLALMNTENDPDADADL